MDLNTFDDISSSTEYPVDAPMLLRRARAGGFIRTNAAFRIRVDVDDFELAAEPFCKWVHPADVEDARIMLRDKQTSCQLRHRTRDGDYLPLQARVMEHGGDLIILAHGIEARPDSIGLDDADDEATVSGTLHTIAQIVEEQNPGYKCSILLVADGRFVRGAGPSLPEEYNAAIDGFAVGPTVGSCGTAIYWNVPVIVEDIQEDPLWAPFAGLAKEAGVAACWSYPFASKTGRVLGALALYSPVPRAPTLEQLGRLRAAARMTGLAVERGRAEEALRIQRQRELELEEQLRQAAKMEALGVLAGGIAHDFNNILATILANAEFIHEFLPVGLDVQEMLANIIGASQRAGQFCQQMLAYAGRGLLRSSRIELGELLPQVDRLVQAAVSKKTRLEYVLGDEPVYVQGDENQLLQVIMNLVINAAESIGEADGKITVRSDHTYCDEQAFRRMALHAKLPAGEYAHLSVSDTGSGMDAKTIARIFDPFFTTKSTGRGLGLSAVRGIISKHGGAIQIESTLGKGTTFTVVLPCVGGSEATEPKTSSPVGGVSAKRILVVDDEQALRTILSRRLKHSGFDVIEAEDGQVAIDIFIECGDSIDCILLDLSMPKRNGEEVQREIHAMRDDVPIVLMSGYGEQELFDRFSKGRLVEILQKPIVGKTLMKAIHKAIATG